MAVTEDRKYTGQQVFHILEKAKGKTLGEVDSSNQFERTARNTKVTGIAGDVIEQSVFGYAKDSKQECDIEIDGKLVELKTTGVRIPKSDIVASKGKTGDEYCRHFSAKEGISITAVTFDPDIQRDFFKSHFWQKAERLLIVFYEYNSYAVVPACEYANFPIVGYCYNNFTEGEKDKLKSDWEIVRNFLDKVYSENRTQELRYQKLVGFTHKLRQDLLLIELVPGFKKRSSGSYQKPRYRLKKTFVDCIVRGHFNNTRRDSEISLKESFSSFAELDNRCHDLTLKYKGKTLDELKEELTISFPTTHKQFTSKCILAMFGAECKRLNQIKDFSQAGIIAKCITVTPGGGRTEDMKLQHIDFEEWGDRDMDFENSAVYNYFTEHSFLCPVFCEGKDKTTFEGFKRFSFDDSFLNGEVRKTWEDSRKLIHSNELVWEYKVDRNGNRVRNKTGSYVGAPNFPKSADYEVFFRGGANDSREESRTEIVNGIRMLPQYFWIKGLYITEKLNSLPFI